MVPHLEDVDEGLFGTVLQDDVDIVGVLKVLHESDHVLVNQVPKQ